MDAVSINALARKAKSFVLANEVFSRLDDCLKQRTAEPWKGLVVYVAGRKLSDVLQQMRRRKDELNNADDGSGSRGEGSGSASSSTTTATVLGQNDDHFGLLDELGLDLETLQRWLDHIPAEKEQLFVDEADAERWLVEHLCDYGRQEVFNNRIYFLPRMRQFALSSSLLGSSSMSTSGAASSGGGSSSSSNAGAGLQLVDASRDEQERDGLLAFVGSERAVRGEALLNAFPGSLFQILNLVRAGEVRLVQEGTQTAGLRAAAQVNQELLTLEQQCGAQSSFGQTECIQGRLIQQGLSSGTMSLREMAGDVDPSLLRAPLADPLKFVSQVVDTQPPTITTTELMKRRRARCCVGSDHKYPTLDVLLESTNPRARPPAPTTPSNGNSSSSTSRSISGVYEVQPHNVWSSLGRPLYYCARNGLYLFYAEITKKNSSNVWRGWCIANRPAIAAPAQQNKDSPQAAFVMHMRSQNLGGAVSTASSAAAAEAGMPWALDSWIPVSPLAKTEFLREDEAANAAPGAVGGVKVREVHAYQWVFYPSASGGSMPSAEALSALAERIRHARTQNPEDLEIVRSYFRSGPNETDVRSFSQLIGPVTEVRNLAGAALGGVPGGLRGAPKRAGRKAAEGRAEGGEASDERVIKHNTHMFQGSASSGASQQDQPEPSQSNASGAPSSKGAGKRPKAKAKSKGAKAKAASANAVGAKRQKRN
ncbi:unnamed protein product [Amoebophrya sp. A25]|nr:unnamed protein product [Amoebophrya sp. A25]|eukprot:GSA25T00000863001.1